MLCFRLGNSLVSNSLSNSLHQFGLPSPSHVVSELTVNSDYLKEASYNVEQLSKSVRLNITKLNSDQSHVYFEVMRSVDSASERFFFLDAPGRGGTGKTFLMNLE